MALRYKEAFGLKDNPFGPRLSVGKVPPVLTRELEKRPLLMHKHRDLEPLYCAKIPSFQSACDNLETLLEANGYSTDPPSRGVTSYLIAVEGDRGSGKTTLASRMLQLMLKRAPEGEPAWHVEELLLRSTSQTVTEQTEELRKLEEKILAGQMDYSCILVDDLHSDAYPYAARMYDSLLEKCVVFMIFTSFDPRMAEQIERSLHSVQRFRIGPLTPDDAIAFVNARYQFFRVAEVNAPPLFPFDENDIRTAVKVKAWSGTATTGPVNLRLIASILESALTSRLQEIAKARPAFDLNAAPSEQLSELQIKVAQSYKVVVRT